MSTDNNSEIKNDHSGNSNNRVIVNTKKIGYFKKLILLFFAGSGAKIGNEISWFLSPKIGPTTRIFSAVELYGEI